jgi:hypothetical protein
MENDDKVHETNADQSKVKIAADSHDDKSASAAEDETLGQKNAAVTFDDDGNVERQAGGHDVPPVPVNSASASDKMRKEIERQIGRAIDKRDQQRQEAEEASTSSPKTTKVDGTPTAFHGGIPSQEELRRLISQQSSLPLKLAHAEPVLMEESKANDMENGWIVVMHPTFNPRNPSRSAKETTIIVTVSETNTADFANCYDQQATR